MTSLPIHYEQGRLLRYSKWDALLVALAVLHGLVLLVLPWGPIIAVGIWWNSNTISHNFIHKPFFQKSWMNRLFSAYLSLVLGIPQTLWRSRHLAHHANASWRLKFTRQLLIESALVMGLWYLLAAHDARFFIATYVPAYLAGLLLCQLQGHYEHCSGTISHYGRIYNALCFNDGYHVEHHGNAAIHWTQLKAHEDPGAASSRWPAVLRWLDDLTSPGLRTSWPILTWLERCVIRSPRLRGFVLDRHERAFRRLVSDVTDIHSAAIVGGALFPRTALLLQRIAPDARLTVIDANPDHIRIARSVVDAGVRFIDRWYDARQDNSFDLLVFPLSYVGDRDVLYCSPNAPIVVVHDWIWRRRGEGVVVSWLLLKRLNLVRRAAR